MKTLFIILGGGLIFLGARGLGSRPTTVDEQKLLLNLSSNFRPDYLDQFSLTRCESSMAKTNLDGRLELELLLEPIIAESTTR